MLIFSASDTCSNASSVAHVVCTVGVKLLDVLTVLVIALLCTSTACNTKWITEIVYRLSHFVTGSCKVRWVIFCMLMVAMLHSMLLCYCPGVVLIYFVFLETFSHCYAPRNIFSRQCNFVDLIGLPVLCESDYQFLGHYCISESQRKLPIVNSSLRYVIIFPIHLSYKW